MINTLVFVLCLVSSGVSHTVHGIQNTVKEDFELERQLKIINKPPIKSIHTKFGDIVDCIDINKQLAFDHPLLKNHKLQKKPSFQKSFGESVKNSLNRPIFGLENDQYCPPGSVPVRRTTKDDLIRQKSSSLNYSMNQLIPGVHVAEVIPLSKFGPYYGVSGINSAYNPKVRGDALSSSHLWVENGPQNTNNKIMAGWHVHPQLYGDGATYFFAQWTSDNAVKTGCYNLRCPGFVQTNQENYLGARILDISTYGGLTYEFSISITQDHETKNWWLTFHDTILGYFPAELFSNLKSADQVGWGGRTHGPPGQIDSPMGSGSFPDHNYAHACYFRQIAFQNAQGQNQSPTLLEAQTFTDNPDCYGVSYYGEEVDHLVKFGLQFGGPGGSCAN